MSRLAIAWMVAVALLLGGVAALGAASRVRVVPREPAPVPLPDGTAPVAIAGPPDSLVARVVGAHPFRPDRRPPARAYEPAQPGGSSVAGEAPPRPALRLAGLLWGSVPRVIVEGVPGREGAVLLSRGDTAGGLLVRRIEPGRAVIRGYDTTWVLTPRGLW